jgi:hypothetical protein
MDVLKTTSHLPRIPGATLAAGRRGAGGGAPGPHAGRRGPGRHGPARRDAERPGGPYYLGVERLLSNIFQ